MKKNQALKTKNLDLWTGKFKIIQLITKLTEMERTIGIEKDDLFGPQETLQGAEGIVYTLRVERVTLGDLAPPFDEVAGSG